MNITTKKRLINRLQDRGEKIISYQHENELGKIYFNFDKNPPPPVKTKIYSTTYLHIDTSGKGFM